MTLSVKSRKGHRHITQTWSGRDRIGTLAHRAFTPVLCALYLPVVKKIEGGPQHSTVHWRVEKQVGSESSLNIFPPRYKWRKYQARGVNARGSRLQFEVVYDHLQVSHENHFSFCSRVQNIITTSLFASFNNHSKALGWARIATIQVEKIKRSILIKRLKHINITGLLLAFDREL